MRCLRTVGGANIPYTTNAASWIGILGEFRNLEQQPIEQFPSEA
jgi:hypothetical protein